MDVRWWENYFVRYLVGTITGAVIVLVLVAKGALPISDSLDRLINFGDAQFLGVSLVVAAGFAYCYIASAPVLTLHALRAHLRFEPIRKYWIRHLTVGLVVPAAIWAGEKWSGLPSKAYWPLAIALGSQVALLFAAASTKFNVVEAFYRTLAGRRSKASPKKEEPPTPGAEYVTSYRHLREHGNAVLILLMQGVLAFVIVNLPDKRLAGWVVGLWLLPAATVWLIGNLLESRLISKEVTAV